MKQLKAVFFSLVVAVAMMACGGEATHDHAHGDGDGHDHGTAATDTTAVKVHGASKEYTSAYVCPMHCPESGSDQAGKCPVCGMDYVALTDHANDGHVH